MPTARALLFPVGCTPPAGVAVCTGAAGGAAEGSAAVWVAASVRLRAPSLRQRRHCRPSTVTSTRQYASFSSAKEILIRYGLSVSAEATCLLTVQGIVRSDRSGFDAVVPVLSRSNALGSGLLPYSASGASTNQRSDSPRTLRSN